MSEHTPEVTAESAELRKVRIGAARKGKGTAEKVRNDCGKHLAPSVPTPTTKPTRQGNSRRLSPAASLEAQKNAPRPGAFCPSGPQGSRKQSPPTAPQPRGGLVAIAPGCGGVADAERYEFIGFPTSGDEWRGRVWRIFTTQTDCLVGFLSGALATYGYSVSPEVVSEVETLVHRMQEAVMAASVEFDQAAHDAAVARALRAGGRDLEKCTASPKPRPEPGHLPSLRLV